MSANGKNGTSGTPTVAAPKTPSVPPANAPAPRASGLPVATDRSWRNLLVRGPRGGLAACPTNVALILSHEPAWRDEEGRCILVYDEFIGDIVATRPPPWPNDIMPSKPYAGDWTSSDTLRTGMWLARSQHGLVVNETTVGEGLRVVAERRRMHPVREWLETLTWDGVPRLDTWLIRLASAEDNVYVRDVGACFLIAAVARVMPREVTIEGKDAGGPGCKHDCMLILEGAQGIGKSTLVHDLAPEKWYLETNIEIGTKDSYQVLRRKWIVEFGELEGLSRSEASRAKQYLAQRTDTYRPSYGRGSEDFPRQCVFTGTTNAHEYLKDDSGARRQWPMKVGKINLNGLRQERDQLWAEAVVRFKAQADWHLTRKESIDIQIELTEERRQRDPWEELFGKWLSLNADMVRGVTTHDALTRVLKIPADKLTRFDEMRAANVLRMCGWDDVQRVRQGGVLVRVYRPNAGLAEKIQELRDNLRKEKEKKAAEAKSIADAKARERLERLAQVGTAKVVKIRTKMK